MTATNPPRPAEPQFGCPARHSLSLGGPALRSLGVGGIISAAILALVPKCALCLLAYVGLGAALGLTGPELCGAPASSVGHSLAWLPALGLAVGTAGFIVARKLSLRPPA
jgi:hypothetical protein